MKVYKFLMKLFWLFLIGSFAGYILETVFTIVQGHYEVRKGLIYGPLIPVYGIGIIIFHIVLSKIKLDGMSNFKKIPIIFVLTMFLGGVIEFYCSYFQEKIFGTISWDYSYLRFNIAGRTCLLFCLCWGILGSIYYFYVLKYTKNMDYIFSANSNFINVVTGIAVIVMVADISISSMASYRQYERRQKIPAETKLQSFLDEKYTDEYLAKIYVNLIYKTNRSTLIFFYTIKNVTKV